MNNTIIAMLVDLCIILFIAASVWFAAKRGFVRTLIELIGCIIAISVAFSFSSFLSDKIYESGIRPGLVESVNTSVSGKGDNAITDAVNDTWDKIPSFITSFAAVNGVDKDKLRESISAAVKNGTANVGEIVADNVVKPLVTSAISFILALIIFALLMILVRFIAKKVNKVANLPVLGTANKILGGVFGLCKGSLIAFAVIMLISILMPLFQNKLWIFTPELIDNSHLFRLLYTLSPFANI